jgi:hypothetical protein
MFTVHDPLTRVHGACRMPPCMGCGKMSCEQCTDAFETCSVCRDPLCSDCMQEEMYVPTCAAFECCGETAVSACNLAHV